LGSLGQKFQILYWLCRTSHYGGIRK